MSETEKKFPAYMNAQGADGERSKGPAVVVLQIILAIVGSLMAALFRGGVHVRITGVYDEATVNGVKWLQRLFNSMDTSGEHQIDVDGNCGPDTRERAFAALGVKLEHAFALIPGKGRYAQDDGTMVEWSNAA